MDKARTRTSKKLQSAAVRQFSERLKSLRRERGLSQMQLAIKANIHLSYLGRLERGESAPSLDTIVQFADAFGVPVSEMIFTDKNAEPSITGLRSQVRENVAAVLRLADPVVLQTLAIVAASLARTR